MADSILRLVRENLEAGDSMVELAEKFVDDTELEQQHPALNAAFRSLIASAEFVNNYLET
jgi:hypothetical protein